MTIKYLVNYILRPEYWSNTGLYVTGDTMFFVYHTFMTDFHDFDGIRTEAKTWILSKKKLIVLCQKMSDLTAPECSHACKLPHSCCSAEYCDMAKQYAKEYWDIDLVPTDHPKLPFMGKNGCTVPPHLRPICTVHTCEVNSLGRKANDPGDKWTTKYFKLREQIDEQMFLCNK